MEDHDEIIQYVPFTSFVHPSFWHKLTELKLDVDKLNETKKQIFGRYTYRSDIGPVFEVDGTSFNKTPGFEHFYINVTGTIINKNTIEEFKLLDKATQLNSIGETLWNDLKKKSWINHPNTLMNFFVLSFADLKKFNYYYWFAFPAPSKPTIYLQDDSSDIRINLNTNQINDLSISFKALDDAQKPFFVAIKGKNSISIKTLTDILDGSGGVKDEVKMSDIYFVFSDPSKSRKPGWPLRIFLAVLLDHCPSLVNSDIKVIGLRCDITGGILNSLVFSIKMPREVQSMDGVGWVGWEMNEKRFFGPRVANMSASMDPIILAETSSDLNIKLMKWRLVPDIDVDVMKTTKCLLLGAGTLGCHVARDLLAWGFRHITFIDSGKVSYSNPTRQVLFNFQDCHSGGRKKAEAAADNLKLILPTAISQGIVAHIPMPGHPVGTTLRAEIISNIKLITKAIEEHDVIFLLLDTREARWLPTLIAAHHGKIVINAALGFDSYLVMRHGASSATQAVTIDNTCVPGSTLGCYFCNDVTAPGNSLKDRTLDQQCTVTRPGVAAIAGALAVEILVGLLQHPLRGEAPALYNSNNETDDLQHIQGVLGPVPHSVRGFLHSYQTVVPTCTKFKQCIACSDVVIDLYRKDGLDFILKVLNSGTYLEEVTGLSELHLTAEMTDIITFSDEEE